MKGQDTTSSVDASLALRDGGTARPAETLFATRRWFELWLLAFGGSRSGWWHVSPPDAIATEIPYVIEIRRIGPVALRVAIAAANSHSPRFDVCGPVSPSANDLRAMMHALDVDALVFPYVSVGSKLAQVFGKRAIGISYHRDFCEAAPYIDCTATFEEYLESRGKASRTTWLKHERRIQKAGCALDNLTDWREVSPYFEEILAVEASGWKGKAGSAISQDRTLRKFYFALCEELGRCGSLRVFLLRKDRHILAFQICGHYAGTLSLLKTGYREDYAGESPGQVLQLQILRWAFTDPSTRIIDMLGPLSENKMKWATGVEQLFTYYVFRPSIGGAVAKFRWKTAPTLKERLRRTRVRNELPGKQPLARDPDATPGGIVE